MSNEYSDTNKGMFNVESIVVIRLFVNLYNYMPIYRNQYYQKCSYKKTVGGDRVLLPVLLFFSLTFDRNYHVPILDYAGTYLINPQQCEEFFISN